MTVRKRLVATARAADVARIETLLELAGAESVSLLDAADEPLLEPEPGRTPLWPQVEVHALFDAEADAARVAAWLEDAVPELASSRVETVDEAEADAAGRPPIGPREIGRRLLVVPADQRVDAGERVPIHLGMGLAFGTGEHATTRMCLEWIERELEPGAHVVDYGCGSGVLAIAALALGAASAWAVDVDAQALEATADNAALNGVADALTVSRPHELTGTGYDVVLANILAIPLIGLADTFARLLVPRGRVVLTGILDAQAEGVISAYASSFEEFECHSSEGWSLVTARCTGPPASSRAPRRA